MFDILCHEKICDKYDNKLLRILEIFNDVDDSCVCAKHKPQDSQRDDGNIFDTPHHPPLAAVSLGEAGE